MPGTTGKDIVARVARDDLTARSRPDPVQSQQLPTSERARPRGGVWMIR